MPEPLDWRRLPPVPEDERPILSGGWQPSQTFLRLHDRCDRAAMLYLLYKAGAGGHQLNRGALAHDTFARLTRHAIERPEPEGRVASPEVGKDLLREVLEDNPALQVSAVERDALRYMVSNFCLGEYWDPARVLAIETAFTLEIGGYTIVGRIDRAEERAPDTIAVVDYKTSFNMVDPDEFKAESTDEAGNPRFSGDFQTLLYSLGLAEGKLEDGMPLGDGYERFELELVYPRYLRPEGLARRKATVTRVQLLDFKLDVEDQLRRLRDINLGEGRWQPTSGSVCRECPAAAACPLPEVLRPESQYADIETVEELERAGTLWYFGQKENRALKARIKKAAELLGDKDEAALAIPDGRGIYIARDRALMFVARETEKIRDKAELAAAVDRAVTYGEPFNMADYVRLSDEMRFEDKAVTPRPDGND